MSGNKRTEAWDRTLKAAERIKPMAAQIGPLARSTGDATRRNMRKTRAWAAPQFERTGHVLQDTVAPKVSRMLYTAARRIEPAKPRRGQWRVPVAVAAAVAAAASAAAAVLNRNRNSQVTTSADAMTVDPTMTGGDGEGPVSQRDDS